MKKKFILILAVLLFCSGIYVVARGFQTKNISENQTEGQSSIAPPTDRVEENNNTPAQPEGSKQTDTTNNNTASKADNQSKPAAANPEKNTPKPPEAAINFKVTDTISNKTILTASADLENKTVGEVTTKLLDSKGISYRARGVGDTMYFSSIAGLTETKAGPESGWCFFVNGVKYSIGAGSYKLKKGDIVEWKYLKDGVSN